jgi:D-alanyl-D-alanine carboxypeptidase
MRSSFLLLLLVALSFSCGAQRQPESAVSPAGSGGGRSSNGTYREEAASAVRASFGPEEYFLHPGDTLRLLFTVSPPSPAPGFVSSRPEFFEVNAEGEVNLSDAALTALRRGDFASGQQARISFAAFPLVQCTVILKKDPQRSADDQGRILAPGDYDALVNKERSLPAGYIPEDLVFVEVPTCLELPEVRQMRREASRALSELFAAASAAGFELTARSGYRAYATQAALYTNYVRNQGQEYADQYSARPGTSEHQTGLVMDITSPGMNFQLDESFGETPEGIWTAANAQRFGFIIRYPLGKEDITGYAYEPWHLRYVKPALAEELYRRGLTMEEFFNLP